MGKNEERENNTFPEKVNELEYFRRLCFCKQNPNTSHTSLGLINVLFTAQFGYRKWRCKLEPLPTREDALEGLLFTQISGCEPRPGPFKFVIISY